MYKSMRGAKNLRVGYLGPRGTFTEEASRRHFAGQDVSCQPYPAIWDVLDAVQAEEVDFGVVPIENSIEGAVNMTLDRLGLEEDLFVVAELVLPIEQNLLVNKGTTRTSIRQIWSHPQALAQCRAFIRELGVPVKTWDSTAQAAAEVAASGRVDVAAIGTRFAAEYHGLVVLQAQLQDNSANHTRFVVVKPANESTPTVDLDANKTMLLLTLPSDRTGALVHALNVFAAVGLNLTRIESRPTRKQLGTYQFFIDVAAGMQEEAVQKAITVLDTLGHQTRILGSYRASKQQNTVL